MNSSQSSFQARLLPVFLVPALLVIVALAATACSSTPNSAEPAGSTADETPALLTPTGQPEQAPTAQAAKEAPTEPVADEDASSPAPKAPKPIRPPGEADDAAPASSRGSDIRQVDFENGFTYEDAAFSDTAALVDQGEFVNGELGDSDYFFFNIDSVVYGDLNGDGVEEAVVTTGYSGGGSGYFQSVRAYRVIDGAVTPSGAVPFGDRAFGGVAHVSIEDEIVSVLQFVDGEGSCCPSEAAVVQLVLGQHFLVSGDTGESIAHVALSQFEERRLLSFLPNTSGLYASISATDLDSPFSFEAGPGQVLTIDVVAGPAPSMLSVSDTTTGEEVGSGAGAITLPSDAIYEVDIAFDEARDEQTILLVQIDAQPETVSWVPAAEQVVVSNEPEVRSSLTWPVFSSDAADGLSVDAANAELAALVLATDDLWLEDVQEAFTPQGESNYELAYEVSYADGDLVAVSFDYYDYVCCRAHPNSGPIATVLDLRNGRIIAPTEILDYGRIDEITQLWLDGLEAQGQLPDDLFSLVDPDQATFSSVGLVPEGIEFGTRRGELVGVSPGTTVVLTFGDLGDLVQPEFRNRLDD